MSERPRPWLAIWPTTRWFAVATVATLLLAASPGFPALAWGALLLALLLAIGSVADALLGPRGRDVSVERLAPERISLGTPARLAYRIVDRGPIAVRVGIFESPVRTLRVPIEEIVLEVNAASECTREVEVAAVARGRDELGALAIWYENALGLLRRRRWVAQPQPIRVYPDLSAVERYGRLHLRRRASEEGLRQMRRRGSGTEFASLREWNSGDPFRHINWKATARRGKMIVTEHESERSQQVMVLLDCGRTMTARTEDGLRTLDYAVSAALSIASVAGLTDDRVGVVAFARDVLVARPPRPVRASLAALTDALGDVEPRLEESDYARAFARVRRDLHRRSLVVVLTDALASLAQPPIAAELQSLARHHLVVCAATSDGAVARTLASEPSDAAGAYRASAALWLVEERRRALAVLQRAGVLTLDAPAKALGTAIIDRYLRIKERGAL